MDHRRKSCSESGFAIVALSLVLAMLFAFVALAIDAGYAFVERNRMQNAADAAALSAALKLTEAGFDTTDPSGTDATEVVNIAIAVAQRNGLNATYSNMATSAVVGHWDETVTPATFTAAGTPVNAVQVTARRTLPLRFSAVNHFMPLSPSVISIARASDGGSTYCIVPFGIEEHLLNGKDFGDTITISKQSPGNWGKLDICSASEPANCMSAGPRFEEAMRDDVCLRRLQIGSTVSPGTGFAGVYDAFLERMNTNPKITMAVVVEFGNGNSSDVDIVDLISGTITNMVNHGANWELTFEITDRALPGPGPEGNNDVTPKSRALVH